MSELSLKDRLLRVGDVLSVERYTIRELASDALAEIERLTSEVRGWRESSEEMRALSLRIAAERDELRAAPGLGCWQPIETAPKDATSIIIYCPGARKPVQEVFWAIPYEGAAEGYWSTPVGPSGRGFIILPEHATRWMPLPAAPEEQP